jgi:hypothetical protein
MARGIPAAMARERRAIRHHVGGARASDRPEAVNLPGTGPAVINTGEKIYPTPKGAAVLNRQQQRRMKPFVFSR